MRAAILIVILFFGMSGIALSEKPPVEEDTCRLYNAYYMDGNLVSDSQGIIYNGQYRKAASQEECLNQCGKEEKSRAEQVYNFNMPNYILNIECFYGSISLYKKTINVH